MEYAVFVIGTSDEVGGFFYDRLCVFHGDSKTGIFDHGQIVEAVAAADHLLGGKSDTGEKLKKRMRLVDTRGHDLKEERV